MTYSALGLFRLQTLTLQWGCFIPMDQHHVTYRMGQNPEPTSTWCEKENSCRCQEPNLFHPSLKYMSCAHSLYQGDGWQCKKPRKPVRNVFVRAAESDITFCGPKKPVYFAACRKVFVWYIPFRRPAALTVTMTHAVRLFQLYQSHLVWYCIIQRSFYTTPLSLKWCLK